MSLLLSLFSKTDSEDLTQLHSCCSRANDAGMFFSLTTLVLNAFAAAQRESTLLF